MQNLVPCITCPRHWDAGETCEEYFMDISNAMANAASETAMLAKSLQTQKVAADIITKTMDHLDAAKVGGNVAAHANMEMQKEVLSSAYAAKGIGTRLDEMI